MPFVNQTRFSIFDVFCPLPGVYGIFDMCARSIYIGEAENIEERLGQHRRDQLHSMHLFDLRYFLFEVHYDKYRRKAREEELIKEYFPLANRQHNGILPRDIFGWPSVF